MVLVFLAEGFEEIEALTPVDILLRGGITVKTVGITGKQVTGSHGITVTADILPEEADTDIPDAVILPGGMPGAENLYASDFVKDTVLKTYENGGRVAAICASPLVLGRLGLLKDRFATCYPGFEDELIGAKTVKDGVITDGRITCAKGMGVALDFSLELLSLLKNEGEAARVRETVMMPKFAPALTSSEEDSTDLLDFLSEKDDTDFESFLKSLIEEDEESDESEVNDDGAYKHDPDPFTSCEEDFPEYDYPLSCLLKEGDEEVLDMTDEISRKSETLNRIFSDLDIDAKVREVEVGPSFSLFKLQLGKDTSYESIKNAWDHISLCFYTETVRILAPMPDSAMAAVELINDKRRPVAIRSLIENPDFIESDSPNNICLGRTVGRDDVYADLSTLPHLLVGGAVGTGKSQVLHSIITSLFYGALPTEVRLILIDLKRVEFTSYQDTAHLLVPVINDAPNALGALKWLIAEVERRYDCLSELKVRNITKYNDLCESDESVGNPMPRIVVIIDELSELMTYDKELTESYLMRLTQKARAAGIHIIVATANLKPSNLTGVIKANIPSRIALKCTSDLDSRCIIETAQAHNLAPNGDMLYLPHGSESPIRLQGAFVSALDIKSVTAYMKKVGEFRRYDEDVIEDMSAFTKEIICSRNEKISKNCDTCNDFLDDECFLEAVDCVMSTGKASTSLLQRKLCIGYGKAARYLDKMEELGIISAPNGQAPRSLILTPKEWLIKLAELTGEK